MIHHSEHLWNLVRHQPPLERTPHVHCTPLLLGYILLVQDDHGADLLAPFPGRHREDCSLGDLGKRKQLTLDFERRDLFAARLDDVGRLAPEDKVHVAAGPVLRLLRRGILAGRGHGPAHGDVARLEPLALAVVGVDKLLGSRLGIAPVLAEHGGSAQLDLAGALAAGGRVYFGAGCDDGVGVGVDEARLDRGQRPADSAVDAVGKGEAARERHADLGHAEALEEDVAVGEVGPGALDGRGEGGGAGDGEAEVRGRDGGAGCGLEGLGEGAVGGEEARVDGGDDGEEGDFGGGMVATGTIGGGWSVAIDAVCGSVAIFSCLGGIAMDKRCG